MAPHHLRPDGALYKKVKVLSIKEEIKDFKTFLLEGDIPYEAGQYLTLVLQQNSEEYRRSYSFTSAPQLGEPMCIGIKRIQNGFASRRLIDAAQPGDEWLTIGAGGRFILPKELDQISHIFFLAAGSGITPIYSLIKTVLHLHPALKVTLVYSNASPQKTLFLAALQNLQIRFAHQMQVEYLFSNNQELSRARLYRQLLEELIQKHVSVPFSKALYYVCGPESYMRLCSYVLQEAGVPPDHLKKENFAIQRLPPPGGMPSDVAAHTINLQIKNKAYQFTAQYPDTILAAAKKRGISMPYSCEAGGCGNCVARCTGGKVFHSYNEVLTERELAEGFVLTCTAYGVGGDVSLLID